MSRKHHRGKPASPASSRHHSHKKHKRNLNWLWVGVGVLIFGVAAILLLNPKDIAVTEIPVSQAYEEYQQGALFLDVRTKEEWDQGHVAGSTLIPLNELQSRLGELPGDRDIVVICRSGERSREGVTILVEAGFNRAKSMAGGFLAWSAAGYPLETGTP